MVIMIQVYGTQGQNGVVTSRREPHGSRFWAEANQVVGEMESQE